MSDIIKPSPTLMQREDNSLAKDKNQRERIAQLKVGHIGVVGKQYLLLKSTSVDPYFLIFSYDQHLYPADAEYKIEWSEVSGSREFMSRRNAGSTPREDFNWILRRLEINNNFFMEFDKFYEARSAVEVLRSLEGDNE